MKKMKKVWALVLALTMVFSLSATALAAPNPGLILYGDAVDPAPNFSNPDSSVYAAISAAEASTSANVTLVFEAGDALDEEYLETYPDSAFRKVVTVNVTEATGVTVSDALVAASRDASNGLTFAFGGDDMHHPSYLNGISCDGYTWNSGDWGLGGWTFRVNDKMPIQAYTGSDLDGYEGTLIDQTYLKDGAIVHFYYDFASDFDSETGNVAANYIRALDGVRTADGIEVQLQGFKWWMEQTTYVDDEGHTLPTYKMYVYNYEAVEEELDATLYDSTGAVVATATSDENGVLIFSSDLTGGTYLLETDSVPYEFDADSMWADMIDGEFLADTGAYCMITIPG